MIDIPEDIANDNSVKEYRNIPENNSCLNPKYRHYVRRETEQDRPEIHLYYGEWEDVAEQDRQAERIENKRKEIEALQRQLNKSEDNKNERN